MDKFIISPNQPKRYLQRKGDGMKGPLQVANMTTTERDAISSPATGMLVWNTTASQFQIYNGSSWAAVAGSGGGDVTKVGTPIDNQVGVWTGDGTIEGDADLTFDTSSNTLAVAGNAGTSILAQGGANVLVDSPRGTMTLSNIDALDATTEATIEAAIDTLANLTTATSLGTVSTSLTGVLRADAGVLSVDGDVTDIVAAGTESAAGKLELATDAETVTGTDTARATTPANITARLAAPGTIGGTTPGAITGTTITSNTGLMPDANDGAYIGQAGTAFSDVFLASGAVVNFDSGNATLTHSAGLLTSNVPVSLGTSNAITVGSIELGAASDTTITRTGAGAIAVEGAAVLLSGGALGTPSSGTLTNCTGLPVNGIVDDTTSALGIGTLELGHASDTTIARVGAGQISVEGVNVVTTSSTDTLTNKTIGAGALTLAENASIAYDPAGSADGKYTGLTIAGTAGEALAFGDVIVLDVTAGKWFKGSVSAAAGADGDLRGGTGMCVLAAAGADAATTVLLHGTCRADANFPALTIGSVVYATTAGDITVTRPSTTDHIIKVLGFALTADEILFNPSMDYITNV